MGEDALVLTMGVWMEVVVPEMMMERQVYLPSWTDSLNLKSLLMLVVVACALHQLMSGSLAVASLLACGCWQWVEINCRT